MTLHRIMVHVITDSQRHAGHADIVRELIDGAVGLQETNGNLPAEDQASWPDHWNRVERAAQEAGQD